MTVHRINPEDLAKPSGFSHAVTAAGGSLVFVAGQSPVDQQGRIVGSTLTEQFERALLNLSTALDAAGTHPSHLARVTVYTTDPDGYLDSAEELDRIWRKHMGDDYPAMAMIGVTRLSEKAALVQLDGIAMRPVTGRHH